MNIMRDNDDDASDVPKQSNCQRNYGTCVHRLLALGIHLHTDGTTPQSTCAIGWPVAFISSRELQAS